MKPANPIPYAPPWTLPLSTELTALAPGEYCYPDRAGRQRPHAQEHAAQSETRQGRRHRAYRRWERQGCGDDTMHEHDTVAAKHLAQSEIEDALRAVEARVFEMNAEVTEWLKKVAPLFAQ